MVWPNVQITDTNIMAGIREIAEDVELKAAVQSLSKATEGILNSSEALSQNVALAIGNATGGMGIVSQSIGGAFDTTAPFVQALLFAATIRLLASAWRVWRPVPSPAINVRLEFHTDGEGDLRRSSVPSAARDCDKKLVDVKEKR